MFFKLSTVIFSALLLVACGGGRNQPPVDNPSNNNTTNSSITWKTVVFDTPSGKVNNFETAKRVDNLFYFGDSFFNYTGFYLFKSSDMKTSKNYSLPKYPGRLLFVDDEGSVMFSKYFFEDGEEFSKRNGVPTIGNSKIYLSQTDFRKVSVSYDKGLSYSDDGVKIDQFSYPKSAFNGIDRFFLIGNDGVLILKDLAKTLVESLGDIKDFEVITSNKYHSNVVFVAKGGGIYRSLDSGDNWLAVNEPTYKGGKVLAWGDIELLDDGTLIALVSSKNLGAQKGLFFESKDLGITWNLVGEPVVMYSGILDARVDINGSDKFYILNRGGADASSYSYRDR